MDQGNHVHDHTLLYALTTILNSMDALIFVSDIDTGEVLFVNGRMKEHLNMSAKALGGFSWTSFQSGFESMRDSCPPPRRPESPGEPVVWEERNTITGLFYRNASRIIDWPDGGMAHLLHCTDITDIKLAEESLKRRLEQEELMSAISQSFTAVRDIRDLIIEALEMTGEFIGANHTFLAKYREDEGCMECLYEWYDEEGHPYIGGESKWPISKDMEIYRDITEKGYAAVNDYFLLSHPNFQTVREHSQRAFLNVPVEVSGEFWGMIGFIISKRAYEWTDSDIHLGQLIAGVFSGAISRRIVENDLYEAKVEAELASRAKGDFLSKMSHEIRTPMNAIIGMTRIARSSHDPQKKEYCLEKIDVASKHLLGLINDILDISKIEANKLELSSSEFDLEKLLINLASVVTFRADEKKQNIIINIGDDVPPVLIGDELRLNQVIANLMTNAIKFTPEGGIITLNIRCAGIEDGDCELHVEVVDTGIGISQEQQARLFSPFEQADSGITRKYGGTGLGLTISKGIVELMRGRIWIESELGKGSKFCFTVHMAVGSAAPRSKAIHAVGGGNIRILAVDSTPEIRDYFLRVMPPLGLPCDVADSGESALEMVALCSYDFCFVDWTTPGLGGIELTKAIKRISRDCAVILMISVSDWNIVEKDAAEAGVDGFISKPLFPSLLADAINEAADIEEESVANTSRTYDFNGHTLLVADDIEINREIISAILEETKAEIDFANNGLEALTLFERYPNKYGLILMDIHMPEMDGYEATKNIRALDVARADGIPIIAMTADVFREDIERCMESGMNDHIGKPLDTDELFTKLDAYLNPPFAS